MRGDQRTNENDHGNDDDENQVIAPRSQHAVVGSDPPQEVGEIGIKNVMG